MSKCENKKCKADQICNPKTGRCVKKSGRIGRTLLKKSKSKRKSVVRKSKSQRRKSKSRKCKEDKILNPKTGRCVKKSGKIGRMLLKKSKSKRKSRKSLKKMVRMCDFDIADGICKITGKKSNDKRCSYDSKFNRCMYSTEFLKTRPKDLILVLQSADDHNRAFDPEGDAGLFSLLSRQRNFNFMYRKIYNYEDLKYLFSTIPKEVKIAKLIIMAHGQPKRIILAGNITTENISRLTNLIKPKMSVNSSILLHSCLTGKGGPANKENFASVLAEKLPGITVFAAEEPIGRGQLLVTLLQDDFNNRRLVTDFMIDPSAGYKIYKFRS